jgi:hypothetical protein
VPIVSRRSIVTLAALAFGALTEVLHWSFGAPLDFLILDPLGGLAFIASGAVAWRRRPEMRTGPLLTLCGVLWFAGSYALMPLDPPVPELGFTLQTLYDLPLAYLLLTFPAERLIGVRRFAIAVLAVGLLGRASARLLLAPTPVAPFASPAGYESVESAMSWVIAAAAVLVGAIALIRWIRARRFLRRIG